MNDHLSPVLLKPVGAIPDSGLITPPTSLMNKSHPLAVGNFILALQ
jgi:hypothetical protein